MIGEHIHSYEINAHLGQGGMGNVYRATDSMLGREVALKMLHPQLTSQPQFLERFKKEARVLAQLLHPNIAVIYNFIEQQGNHYMVMEYVEGTSLDDLLKTYGALPVQLVVPVCVQALEGLQHAHKKNIFHRDIKPSNLMLTPDGTLKLMDFGIAKVAGEQKMTQVNKIVGTVEFMAPELIEGKTASVSSDIYAMGVTLYELVSGKLPFESDTDYNLMQSILKKKVQPPDKLNPSIPKALSDIILKALEKNPDNRYQTARAFQQALVAAFPNYRDIDLNLLRPKQQQTVLVSQYAEGTATRIDNGAALSNMQTKMEEAAKPFSIKEFFREKILTNKRLPYILAGIGLLFFLFIIISVVFNKGDNNNNGSNTNNGNGVAKTDSVKKEEKSLRDGGSLPVEKITPPPHSDDNSGLQLGGDNNTENKTVKQKKKKQEKRDDGTANNNNNTENKDTGKPVEKKEENVQPVVKHEKKTIYIDSRVEVNLYLRENLGDGEGERERSLTFSVTSPVYYQGVVIIRQGAIARGNITIGRMQTSVDISSVMGANGQQVSLNGRLHRRKKDLETDRNYTATIEKGTRMSFE
jgi:eukaryotic-like serine/threonine-protein kinase